MVVRLSALRTGCLYIQKTLVVLISTNNMYSCIFYILLLIKDIKELKPRIYYTELYKNFYVLYQS